MAISENTTALPTARTSRRTFITRTAAMTAGVAIGATASPAAASALSPALAALFERWHILDDASTKAFDLLEHAQHELWRQCPRPSFFRQFESVQGALARITSAEGRIRNVTVDMEGEPFLAHMMEGIFTYESGHTSIADMRAEVEQYQARIDETERALGIPELEERQAAAARDLGATAQGIFAFPANCAADCLAKLRLAVDTIDIDEEESSSVKFLIADLERIAGKAVLT